MHRRPLASCCVLLALMAGCDTPPEPPAIPAEALRDTLVVGIATDPRDLLSPVVQGAFELTLIDLLGARPLDVEFDCELTFQPDFAKSWSWSEDGRTLTLELRDDLKWSDGAKVTARDLTLLGELIRDPAVGSPRAGNLAGLTPDSPALIDDTHVRYTFTAAGRPTVLTANVGLLQIVPSHLLDDPALERKGLRTHPLNTTAPLSSGRWQLASWEKGKSLILEPNPHHPGPEPGLRRVVFRILPDYDTRLLELQTGKIDMMESVQIADADKLVKEHPDIKLHTRGYRAEDYLGWNTVDPKAWQAAAEGGKKPDLDKLPPHPLFGDPDVRYALSMAIDVDRIIQDVLTSKATGKAYATRAYSTITPELCATRDPGIAPVPYDPAAARAALAREGWTDTNGDGVLDKDGVPFRFTMVMPAGNARRTQVSAILQAQLEAIGVDAQIEALEGGALFERLRRRDFDAAYSGWSAGLWAEPQNAWGRDSEFNFTSYHDPKVQELLDRVAKAADEAESTAALNELQRKIYEDQPYTFLYWMDEIVAVDGRFENTDVGLVTPYRHLERWTVPPDKVKYRQ